MQDFSQLNNILGGKAVSQLPNILSVAIGRLSNWESTVRALPGNYQSRYRDAFLYHYDENNKLIDDTPVDQKQALQTMIENAVAQAKGMKNYLEGTTTGIITNVDSVSISPINKVVFGNKLFTKDSLPQNMYLRAAFHCASETAPETIPTFRGDAVLHMYRYTSFGNEVTVIFNLTEMKEFPQVGITQAHTDMEGECYIIIKWLDNSYSVGLFRFLDIHPDSKVVAKSFNIAIHGNTPNNIYWSQYANTDQFRNEGGNIYSWYRYDKNTRFNNEATDFRWSSGGVDGAMYPMNSSHDCPWMMLPNLNVGLFVAISANEFSDGGKGIPKDIISNTTDHINFQDLVNLKITQDPNTDLIDILASEYIDPQSVIDALS